jgi:hypothetical protein
MRFGNNILDASLIILHYLYELMKITYELT